MRLDHIAGKRGSRRLTARFPDLLQSADFGIILCEYALRFDPQSLSMKSGPTRQVRSQGVWHSLALLVDCRSVLSSGVKMKLCYVLPFALLYSAAAFSQTTDSRTGTFFGTTDQHGPVGINAKLEERGMLVSAEGEKKRTRWPKPSPDFEQRKSTPDRVGGGHCSRESKGRARCTGSVSGA